LIFGDFQLDLEAQTLTRNGVRVVLRRKTWDVLRYLSERPGKLVSRAELAEAIWGDVVVADEVVSAAVRELRRALSGSADVIETVRGRGFRFIAPVTVASAAADDLAVPAPTRLVGRAEALQQLSDAWQDAAASSRRIVFVTGRAGIGKTALVDSFVGEITAGESRWRVAVGRGECGASEFHAIVGALEHLCRSRRGDDMAAALHRYGPEWLARLNVRRKSPVPASGNATNSEERLIAGALDALTRVAEDFPLLLVLEDLHRCDARTKILLRRLAQRYDAPHLLVIGTYRTDAADLQATSLREAWQDLVARNRAREIALAPLDRAGVEAYLDERHPGLADAPFLDWVYRHSRGNPALLRTKLDELIARAAVRCVDGVWQVADAARIGGEYVTAPVETSFGGATGPFVGRVAERARLDAAWRKVRRGQRRTVIVVGDPGIGKTAMVRRFLDDLAVEPGAVPHVVIGKCTEQRSRSEAYMPVLDMFESWMRDDSSGEVTEQLIRLAPHWARQMPGTERTAVASALVAVDARPERMMREAAALIEAMAQARPLVIVFEDAHWADPATIELLSYVATRSARARLLILVTYRPAEAAAQPELVGLQLASRDDIERLELRPLSPAEIRAWLESTFDHSAAVVDHIADEAVRRSSGNPLFLQAVTRSLATSGCIERTAEGWMVRSPALPCAGVPLELSGLIASQLRLLPDTLRQIVYVASVAGEEFDAASLAGAIDVPLGAIDAELTEEARRSFILMAAGSSVWPDGTTGGRYRFRHALYQRALYDALPPHDRARMHRAIAAAIERGFADRLTPVTTQLAEHYSAGGDHSAAAGHLERSALLMIDRSALREAIHYFERAIEALACLPDDPGRRTLALRSHVGCGLSHGLLEGPQSAAAQQHAARVRELLPRVDDLTVIVPGLRLLWFRDLFSWDYAGMVHSAEELLRRSENQANPLYRSLALSLQGITACYRGAVETARRDLEESLRLCDDPRRLPSAIEWVIDPRVETRCYLAWMLWLNGFPDRSRALLEEALRLADDGGHESTRCLALWFAASMSQLRRDEKAYEYAEELNDYSRHVGFDVWRQFATVLHAVAKLERGDERALDEILRKLTAVGDQPSALVARAYLLGQLALAYGRRGDPQDGMMLIELGLARIADNGLRVSESELLRIRGNLQQIAGDAIAADASYLKALQVARAQGARVFELRAAAARVRLHWESGARQTPRQRLDALAELEAIYRRFSEGFESRDLVETRTLLSSLPT